MTKSEVLKELAEELELTQADTESLYDSFVEGLTVLLSRGKGFTLPGLGSFHAEIRAAHKSYNPHYEKMMRIPEKQVVHFSQSSTIRDQINNEGENE
ncbi:MAG: HU family DNA-binding protein [Balneolaceae bacterium]